jgi:hypothetical protein
MKNLLESSNELNSEQIKFLNVHTYGTWKFNNSEVDIDGIFDMERMAAKDFKGIVFGKVSKNFYCKDNQLVSLSGAPKVVGGKFDCSFNQLVSLEFGPKEIGSDFVCSHNKITSLEFAPEKIGAGLHCEFNSLVSLEGLENKTMSGFYYYRNPVSVAVIGGLYRIMRKGKTYQSALGEYWDDIPEEEQLLMYKDNSNLSDKEKRGYATLAKIKGLI